MYDETHRYFGKLRQVQCASWQMFLRKFSLSVLLKFIYCFREFPSIHIYLVVGIPETPYILYNTFYFIISTIYIRNREVVCLL